MTFLINCRFLFDVIHFCKVKDLKPFRYLPLSMQNTNGLFKRQYAKILLF